MTRKRRDESILDDLLALLLVVPAWVGPPLALLAYLLLRSVVPAIFGGGPKPDLHTMISGIARGMALPAAGLVVFVWLLAEFQKWQRRRLLDGQSGLSSIRDLSWQEFEHLVGEAYRRQGYAAQEVGSTSGDGGIDLLLARAHERVVVQCKLWKTRRVGVRPVRELYGVMTSERATQAILVTCGSFTAEARKFAQNNSVVLIEGPELSRMVNAVRSARSSQESNCAAFGREGISPAPTQSRQVFVQSTPKCPKCSAVMILRYAQKGPHAGSQFWGCTMFPNCRGKQEFRSS